MERGHFRKSSPRPGHSLASREVTHILFPNLTPPTWRPSVVLPGKSSGACTHLCRVPFPCVLWRPPAFPPSPSTSPSLFPCRIDPPSQLLSAGRKQHRAGWGELDLHHLVSHVGKVNPLLCLHLCDCSIFKNFSLYATYP
jgi:hypothetical protein